MDGYAVIARDTGAAQRATLRCVGQVFTGQVPSAPLALGSASRSRRARRCRTAPTPSSWSRRRKYGRGRPGRFTSERLSRRARTSAGGPPTSPAGQAVVTAGQVLTRAGSARSRRPAARRSMSIAGRAWRFSRRATRSSSPAVRSRRARSTTSTASRSRPCAAPRRRADDAADGRGHARGSPRPRVDAARAYDVIVFSGGSSVGERDLVIDILTAAGRGDRPRHRGQAGQADGLRPHRPHAGARHARLSDVVPVERLHPAGAVSAPAGAPAGRGGRPRSTLPLSRRVTRRRAAPVLHGPRDGGRAEPAFKASGDITSMAHADGYIEIPAPTEVVEAGTVVTVRLF